MGYIRVVSANGERAITGSGLGDKIVVWDLRNGEKLQDLLSCPGGIRNLAITPDDQRLIYWSSVRTSPTQVSNGLTIFNLVTGTEEQRILTDVSTLSISPDGKLLAYTGRDGLVIYNFSTQQEEGVVRHSVYVSDTVFCSDNRFILLVPNKGSSIELWDISTGQFVTSFFTDYMVRGLRLCIKSTNHSRWRCRRPNPLPPCRRNGHEPASRAINWGLQEFGGSCGVEKLRLTLTVTSSGSEERAMLVSHYLTSEN